MGSNHPHADMIDLVLCYASEERDRVAPWLEALKAEGLRVGRLGVGTKGTRLSGEVREHLLSARLVLVAWTAEGARRPALADAVAVARGAGTLLLVRVDPVEPPDGVPPAVDLTVAAAPYTALLRAVGGRLASPQAHAPPPPPPPPAPPPLPRPPPPLPVADDLTPDGPTADEPPRLVPLPPRVGSRAADRAPRAEARPPEPGTPPPRLHTPSSGELPRGTAAPALPDDLEPTSRPRPERPRRRGVAPLIVGLAVLVVAGVVAAGFLGPSLLSAAPSRAPARIDVASTASVVTPPARQAERTPVDRSAAVDRVRAARRARLATGDPEVRRLVELGWQEADRSSWVRALDHFAQIDLVSPGHPDAAFGAGYAELHRGRPEVGRRQLCRARAGVSDVERDAIRAILAERGMACD